MYNWLMSENNIVKIIWDDAGGFGCDEVWQTKDLILDSYRAASFTIVSVGHIIFEDDDSIVIAQSYDEEFKQFANCLRIPKGMVLKITIV